MNFEASLPLRAALALVLITSVGTAAATSMLDRDPNSIVAVEGALSDSNDLTVDSQRLTYSGTEIEGVSVVVNNTGTTHEGVAHVALRDSSGNLVASKSTSTQTFAGSDTTTVTVTFASAHSVANVSRVEATVEQTA